MNNVWPVIYLSEVDSTNNYATDKLASGTITENTVVFSSKQTKGKGQTGNTWESDANQNLTFSLVLFPKQFEIKDVFLISQIVSLAIADYLKSIGVESKIKWPNDILVGNKKIAGILIENSVLGSYIHSSVIGIGFNVNQERFNKYSPVATSLKLITAKDFNIKDVFEGLLINLDKRIRTLNRSNYKDIKNKYQENLLNFNLMAQYCANDEVFSGKIIDVENSGGLVILADDGTQRSFMFKEVKYIIGDDI